jgi:hypothetical protein
MRKLLPIIFLTGLILACSHETELNNHARFEKKIRKDILRIAETYAKDNIKDSKTKITKDGLITIGNEEKTYVIDPSKIFIGNIDKDTINDAIITLYPFRNNYEVTNEHLFIINTEGKLMMVRSMESDMRIVSLKDGVITAEVPEHSRSTPLFNCPSCWEVVKFQFSDGELVKIE